MRPSFRPRLIALVRAQWAGLLALFLVIAGGTAYAANTIGSSDIIDGQVKSPDIGNNQVQSADVRDDTLPSGGLTGVDIKDQSGVDTCVLGVRLGQLCARPENSDRTWYDAFGHCTNIGMRLATLGEGLELAKSYDIPGMDNGENFWTDGWDQRTEESQYVHEGTATDSNFGTAGTGLARETLCVTTPTN